MEKYNYKEAVREDIRQYCIDNDIKVTADNREEIEESLFDDLFVSDSVTGNASGSYTFNAYQAEENLCHNHDLLREALEAFGYTNGLRYLDDKGAEAEDVTIRCYLLAQCLSEVLDELEEEAEEETED